jgi:hypothetical protein
MSAVVCNEAEKVGKFLTSRLFRPVAAFRRDSQSLFHGPTSLETLKNRQVPHSCLFGPFGNGLLFSFVRQVVMVASVAAVFLVGDPAAVARLVAAVVINAVDGVLGSRARSHVFVESCEGGSPFMANLYSPRSVETVTGVFPVVTSLDHAIPDIPFSGRAKAVGGAFGGHGRRPCTSTASGNSATKASLGNRTHGSAGTSTQPVTNFCRFVCQANHLPEGEFLAGNVDCSRQDSLLFHTGVFSLYKETL